MTHLWFCSFVGSPGSNIRLQGPTTMYTVQGALCIDTLWHWPNAVASGGEDHITRAEK